MRDMMLVGFSDFCLRSDRGIRPKSREGEVRARRELAGGFGDFEVVDAGGAAAHEPVVLELPVRVAVGAPPLAGGVVEFGFKPHGDRVALKRPKFLAQAVIGFAAPFPAEKLNDGGTAVHEPGAVAPLGFDGGGERHALRIAAVPGVLGGLDFLPGGFRGERRERRTWLSGWATLSLGFGVQLGFALGDPAAQRSGGAFDFLGGEARRDVLGAVPVEAGPANAEHPLDEAHRPALGGEFGREGGGAWAEITSARPIIFRRSRRA
jgi:hypothetical protein